MEMCLEYMLISLARRKAETPPEKRKPPRSGRPPRQTRRERLGL